MKRTVLYASIAIMAGLLLTNIYNSIVDAANWGSNIPASIEQARNYYTASNPGDFYRIFSPLNQILAVLALILFWRTSKTIRTCLILALLLAIAGDALTFGYFYPRNEIIFMGNLQENVSQVTDACRQWQSMNWVRSGVALAGLVFQFLALDKLVTDK